MRFEQLSHSTRTDILNWGRKVRVGGGMLESSKELFETQVLVSIFHLLEMKICLRIRVVK